MVSPDMYYCYGNDNLTRKPWQATFFRADMDIPGGAHMESSGFSSSFPYTRHGNNQLHFLYDFCRYNLHMSFTAVPITGEH